MAPDPRGARSRRPSWRARRGWKAWLKPPVRLKFTREGWYYCLFTLGVGTAALNTGNNLLFLVLGLQLTAIVVSGILSHAALQRLGIERLVPADPPAKEPFVVTYRVRNGKRYWPSLTLTLADAHGPFAGDGAFLVAVGPGDVAEAHLTTRAPRRGRFPLSTVVVSTRFPFGLFIKSFDYEVEGEIVVTPALVRARAPRELPGPRDGARSEARPGSGVELLGFRDLRPGDDRRRVHWKKSAAVGRLLVVERERERRRRVVLLIDNRGRAPGEWLDRLAEQAAALARRLVGRGFEVGLATSGVRVAPAASAPALRRLLRVLAVMEAAPPSAPAPAGRRDEALVVAASREAEGASAR